MSIRTLLLSPARTWWQHALDGAAFAICIGVLAWMFLWVLPAFVAAARVGAP